MTTRTHLMIASILYKHYAVKRNFPIDPLAFAIGNIRPDFDRRWIKYSHTLKDSLSIIQTYSEVIMKRKNSINEFSMALGIICHYVCDYFCLYHNRKHCDKDPLGHFFYEILLCKKLSTLLEGNLKIVYENSKEKSVKDIVRDFYRKYNLQRASILKDISYAIVATSSVCDFILSSCVVPLL